MSTYLSKAACRGRRPSAVVAEKHHERPELISRLLRDRNVLRVVVAPFGYGKTHLALEYADTVFSFVHTFWLNAQSPCFIRDLDAHKIARSCLLSDPKARLLVLEDLPPLDDARLAALSSEIDALLENGCEVLVTAEPYCDAIARVQRDAVCLCPADLLLSNAELDLERSTDECREDPGPLVPPARRVAGLLWGGRGDMRGARDRFLRQSFRGEVPLEELFAMAALLMLKRGSLASALPQRLLEHEQLGRLARNFPHLGIDGDCEGFDAFPFDPEEVAASLKPRSDELAQCAGVASRDALVGSWAELLMKAGDSPRACLVAATMGSSQERAEWMLRHAFELARRGCFREGLRLIEGLRGLKPLQKAQLLAFEAVCRKLLGDEEGALRCANRLAFDESSPTGPRICSLLIVVKAGMVRGGDRAVADLLMLSSARPGASEREAWWRALARGWRASLEGPDVIRAYWEECAGAFDDVMLCMLASWLFSCVRDGFDTDQSGGMEPFGVAPKSVERYVRARLEEDGDGGLDYFAVLAGLSMEEAHQRGMAYNDGRISLSVLVRLRNAEMALIAQRQQYERDVRDERRKRAAHLAENPDVAPDPAISPSEASSSLSVPTLTVRMFGRFEVSIGDTELEPSAMRRQNVRALLVMLIIAQGREMSRDAICAALWPDSDHDTACKNFYAVWSRLRRALSLQDGTCPYLMRRNLSCSIDMRYVRSDVVRLFEICRELSMDDAVERAPELFAEVDCDFSGELMPAERFNPLIDRARDDCRLRLIDALVAASASNTAAGSAQYGIWFARAALVHDYTREDAHVALMRAQFEKGQRTAAIMTYLACRKALTEGLGVDPSPETTTLYERILNADSSLSA